MTNEILLPGSFRIDKHKLIGYPEANQVLREYCGYCSKLSDCDINHELRCAMGDNYPFWPKEFVTTEYRGKGKFIFITFCSTFENKQLKLPGIVFPFIDGVEKLIELTKS